MTARDEVQAAFTASKERIRARVTPPGVMPLEGQDDRFVIINENNAAVSEALLALADRIDALEADRG